MTKSLFYYIIFKAMIIMVSKIQCDENKSPFQDHFEIIDGSITDWCQQCRSQQLLPESSSGTLDAKNTLEKDRGRGK